MLTPKANKRSLKAGRSRLRWATEFLPLKPEEVYMLGAQLVYRTNQHNKKATAKALNISTRGYVRKLICNYNGVSLFGGAPKEQAEKWIQGVLKHESQTRSEPDLIPELKPAPKPEPIQEPKPEPKPELKPKLKSKVTCEGTNGKTSEAFWPVEEWIIRNLRGRGSKQRIEEGRENFKGLMDASRGDLIAATNGTIRHLRTKYLSEKEPKCTVPAMLPIWKWIFLLLGRMNSEDVDPVNGMKPLQRRLVEKIVPYVEVMNRRIRKSSHWRSRIGILWATTFLQKNLVKFLKYNVATFSLRPKQKMRPSNRNMIYSLKNQVNGAPGGKHTINR